jgi:hypothetical protein
MYRYQDYPAPQPPVCAFKVRSGAQLKDFIQRGEVTELHIYYNRPAALEALKYTEFSEKYNTTKIIPILKTMSASIDIILKYTWMLLQFNMCIVLSDKKRCICIEMLYVTSGDMFYLRLILLNRKAHSDQDVLTYNPVRGGGEP